MSVARPRPSLPVLIGAISLSLLLILLGSLQHRWLGQVSEAEEARLRGAARARAEPVARELDRELTRAFLLLQVDPASLAAPGSPAYAARHVRWRNGTVHPTLVKDVFVVEVGRARPRRFDPETESFVEAEWPAELEPLRERVRGSPDAGSFRSARGAGPWAPLDEARFALFLPIASFEEEAAPVGARARGHVRLAGFTIVRLDRDYLVGRLLPSLVARHFGPAESSEYIVVIRRREDPKAVVFRSGPDPRPSGADAGDARVSLLDLRFDEASDEDLQALPVPRGGAADRSDLRRFWRRRGGEARGDGGRWELVALRREGSLAEIVAQARGRNLAVSAGILSLLAASAVLVLVTAQRARRLADRQLEFVAGVSHELRTPLAVISSAAENLADGVVTEPPRVREYGRVVRDEGRRLADMVEQVIDLAGTYSGQSTLRAEEVPVKELLEECMRDFTRRPGAHVFETTAEGELPLVRADRAALRRAVRNLVENAVKHGGDGGTVTVRAARGRRDGHDEVRIRVEDRGPGIPPEEVSHLFEPFFRGRRARDRQIRGSGLGLSLVDRIVGAAGGRVEVESPPGRGAAFTIVLPAATGVQSLEAAAEPSHGTPDPSR